MFSQSDGTEPGFRVWWPREDFHQFLHPLLHVFSPPLLHDWSVDFWGISEESRLQVDLVANQVDLVASHQVDLEAKAPLGPKSSPV